MHRQHFNMIFMAYFRPDWKKTDRQTGRRTDRQADGQTSNAFALQMRSYNRRGLELGNSTSCVYVTLHTSNSNWSIAATAAAAANLKHAAIICKMKFKFCSSVEIWQKFRVFYIYIHIFFVLFCSGTVNFWLLKVFFEIDMKHSSHSNGKTLHFALSV